jgi:hypothetical protein
MSDMKCPFCGRELSEYDHFDRLLVCFNPQCEAVFTKKDFLGNKNLWQELIRTRKALDVAVDTLKLMYQGNGDPQDIMRYIDNRWTPVRRLCKQTLEQITALEQKD